MKRIGEVRHLHGLAQQRAHGLTLALGFFLTAAALGCSPSAPTPASSRGTLIESTTAGADRCVLAKSHDRPFVIEWDATDLAAFEAKAARDVVFVRYEGCTLSVLDCRDDGVPGAFGTYASPTWTSGNVESIDIATRTELYGELPLGARKLEGRVQAGESLHLRYFVSGVATSTRDAVYRADLASIPRCGGATHYVWAYNLGAFELSSTQKGAASNASLKRGGALDGCDPKASTPDRACRVPIRIALRSIEEGPRPVAKAAAPVSATTVTSTEGQELRGSARKKSLGGDGAGCLNDLDRADGLDPAGSRAALGIRGTCEMQAGKCDVGRATYKSFLESEAADKVRPAVEIEDLTAEQAAKFCPDDMGTPTEIVLRARMRVDEARARHDGKACLKWLASVYGALHSLPKMGSPALVTSFDAGLVATDAIRCAGAEGFCKEAKEQYVRMRAGKKPTPESIAKAESDFLSYGVAERECSPKKLKKK